MMVDKIRPLPVHNLVKCELSTENAIAISKRLNGFDKDRSEPFLLTPLDVRRPRAEPTQLSSRLAWLYTGPYILAQYNRQPLRRR